MNTSVVRSDPYQVYKAKVPRQSDYLKSTVSTHNINLNYAEMPMSFVGQALFALASSKLLNPPNLNQNKINIIIGKPLRFLARLICQIFITILSPLGIIYHGSKLLFSNISANDFNRNRLKEEILSYQHFKAAINDLIYLTTCGMNKPFFIKPNNAVSFYLSASLVQIENKIPIYDLSQSSFKTYSFIKRTYLTNMHKGLYRFDKLVFAALQVREKKGELPKLDSYEVQEYYKSMIM